MGDWLIMLLYESPPPPRETILDGIYTRGALTYGGDGDVWTRPQSIGSFGDRLNKERGKKVFQWGQKNIRGSFGEDFKQGFFSEALSS